MKFSLAASKQVLVMIACLLGYALVLEWAGYLISVGLLVFIAIKMRSPGKWASPMFWAIGVSLVSYFVFSTLLECKFPRGTLFGG